ncbi:ABC transporter ATP-binding protein [Halococcus sediminicola]|uniref:ABC transporter ATP-binding protein n=1 Tax=Halococcus sediminicola TaxID=1264579 RepID=UPI000678DB1C|nr:ABC transporter ATP-binding protein [Halococcus sediminicola]
MTDPLLSVHDLRTHFQTSEGTVRAVDGIDFDIHSGETVCLVGESGSGKTVACESITRLVPTPPGDITGAIRFDGGDLTEMRTKTLRRYRGDRIAHIFQNPQDALDPVYTVGTQLAEAIQFHRDESKSTVQQRAVELLDRVGIPEATSRIDEYPHEFSGGMKQRVVIAMALAADPDMLIADEPTTALDVTTQARILDLLNELKRERDMAILFVTHDLGVVAEMADRVLVLYAGKVMERGHVYDVFESPAHPYTQALFRSLPRRNTQPEPIGGTLPSLVDPPDGCRFHPRCPHAIGDCTAGSQPPLEAVSDDSDRGASCVFYDDDHDQSVVDEEVRTSATMGGARSDRQVESERIDGSNQ